MKKSIYQNKMIAVSYALIFGAVFLLTSAKIFAQTKPSDPSTVPPGQRAVEAEPQSTTATFGDWILRCNRMVEAGGQAQRLCEVAQTVIIQGQQAPVAEVAVGRIKKIDPLRVSVMLPVNVAFPSAPRVFSDSKDTEGLELTWKRCLPNGCLADAIPKEEVLRNWRGTRTTGRIETKDAFGRNVVVTISFRGLAQALDALNKEL